MSDLSNKLATFSDTTRKAVVNTLKDLHTALPGIIESFDSTTQLATVQPAVRRIFKTVDENIEMVIPTDLPKLINVPVVFPKGGGFSLTFPISKGDECLLIFCERDISSWYEKGGVQTPNKKRFHSLSDAVAHVGISSKINPISNFNNSAMELRNSDRSTRIELGDSGTIDIHADTVNVNANTTNLGTGGDEIARKGDTVQVEVTSGSSAGVYDGTITSGGSNTSI